MSRVLASLVRLAQGDVLPHTLMLVGERGLGREALAIELAASLICRAGGDPGCTCPSCERVRRGVHPDLTVVDVLPKKTEIVVEQARDLIDGILQCPYEGRRRVYVFASSQTPPLNVAAASALLKTLEEPPAHSTILLLAANPARVMPTVVSRAVGVRVPPPQRDELLALLASLHGVPLERAAQLFDESGRDIALALGSELERAAELTQKIKTLLAGAMSGDTLSLLRLGSVLGGEEHAMSAAVAAILDAVCERRLADAETALDSGAALLHAGHRSAVLRTDLELAVVGTLAPFVARPSRAQK